LSCFADAAAIVAILTDEPDRIELVHRLERSKGGYVSALAIYDAVLAVSRKNNLTIDDASQEVARFSRESKIEVAELGEWVAQLALEAFDRFGRGRHRASLNLGDCFSYACAKMLRVPLLCRGDDFVHTDIRIA
jgi:ribonuclease VapC